MEWRDHGILLSMRRHGENSAIIDVFTEEHGRHAGMVRGGASRKLAPILQPGAQLDLTWRARLEDHLGSYHAEPLRSRAAAAMSGRLALAGLNAVTALLSFCLPEREPHPDLYTRSELLLDLLGNEELWPLAYLRWELALLEEMGFGLDLTACAVTGSGSALCYVSPKSGRAVSREGAGGWADRLLPLPPVMLGQGSAEDAEIVQALHTTGYFLDAHLAPSLGNQPVPEARGRLTDLLIRRL
ncbi:MULTISPECIES: DNA repair protein RecO [unclassified Leisingera]|uniref:DNA repair protein RecO n=1 Tax=unclassified Leisingera TaxID=2614906 RepID=UPI0010109428|nr:MULTISPECIES: DNA repair protein RecO [unclassified Leisingera]MBQ4825377.1 DNA repair protein RecO [Leisingera sp. HS039]MCF6431636.1 DNA repair protein RecO [Leisingera sp. MMG026]QAX28069.1 DNA repair protein RecO [Leisingera sp. NJS204]QBR37734.1 DNA repair protein RecO [Leisingera sp. NJS201]